MSQSELVDILTPPHFSPSGMVMTKDKAYTQGYWVGAFNLWIIKRQPIASLLFQRRSRKVMLAPLKLDVTVGGHYKAGEGIYDALREAEEELGKKVKKEDILFVGRRIYIGVDTQSRVRKNVVNTFITEDERELREYRLQEDELAGLYEIPIQVLESMFEGKENKGKANGITAKGEPHDWEFTLDDFPYNYDNYLYKMILLVKRHLRGEQNLFI